MTIYSKGLTHSGFFHADDVFSTALLKMVNPSFSVSRVIEVSDASDDQIVYDIGDGKYDHHRKDLHHENGKRFASFGLLWREYGEYISGSKAAARRIEEKIVSVIDESDNGGEYDLISKTISAFNPVWNSNENQDEAFEEAVDFAGIVLKKIVNYERSVDDAEKEICDAIKHMRNKIVVLGRYMPFTESLICSEAIYVIFPSSRGGYCIQGVPISYENRQVKIPFPEKWRGKIRCNNEIVQNIKGLSFCHKTGFLAVADTLEDALYVANLSVKKSLESN